MLSSAVWLLGFGLETDLPFRFRFRFRYHPSMPLHRLVFLLLCLVSLPGCQEPSNPSVKGAGALDATSVDGVLFGGEPTDGANVPGVKDIPVDPGTGPTTDATTTTDAGVVPGPGADPGPQPVCGDGICAAGESSASCPEDCDDGPEPQVVCGDGTCGPGESSVSCPGDCGSVCGDAACNGGEGSTGCPQDCGALCGDGACNGGEGSVGCPQDCGTVCGDGACNGGEDSSSCVADCGWTGTCPEVPAPSPVGDAPVETNASGIWETTSVDGYTDDYLYNAEGSFKVGIRRDWGGTIVFFGFAGDGPGVNDTNVIDSHDTGREVQVAFYDVDRAMQGCAHDASCQSNPDGACPGQITYLGWNPVQGGNECNNGSGVEWVTGDGGVLAMETHPLFWNPDWQQIGCGNDGCSSPATNAMKSDVTYTQRLRFVSSHVVEIEMIVTNLSPVDHYHPTQEFPTLYASFGYSGTPNLATILGSTGEVVSADGQDGNGFNYGDYTSPGGWSTLQNAEQNYGVGLYHENRLESFRAYWKDGVFNNLRAMFPFTIPGNGAVRARAYLMLGGFETVAGLAANLDQILAPFGALEGPGVDANLDGATAPISGWVLDNKGVSQVEILVDGQVASNLPVSGQRPEICALYPGYSMCDNLGFDGQFDLEGLTPCAHLLEVRATDTDGNQRVIARQRFFLNGAGNPGGGDPGGGGDPPGPSCGDGVCDPGESNATCPQDCTAPPAANPTVALYRYRFENGTDEDHMFGTSPSAPATYVVEGVAFALFSEPAAGLVPLYQSYCASCTDHLQTTSDGEGAPNYGDQQVLGYCASDATDQAPKALVRLYNGDVSDHFVTSNPGEVPSAEAAGYTVESQPCWVP